METIADFINGLGIDFDTFWKSGLILLIGTFLISIFGRFVFGKRSTLNNAVSSAFAILFIYGLSIFLRNFGNDFSAFITPLPFVSIRNNALYFFNFMDAHYTTICAELFSMIILAFLVNLATGWLPTGKNIFSWAFFRCVTVAVAYLLHLIVVGLLARYVPEGIATYAPVALISILLLLILTGALRILVGAAISTVNPIIGALYTFFFANIVGKQITKAALTTGILAGLVIALHYAGITAISIASTVTIAFLPLLVIILVLWYVVGHFL